MIKLSYKNYNDLPISIVMEQKKMMQMKFSRVDIWKQPEKAVG